MFVVTGVAVGVDINKMEWQITFKGLSCGLYQRVRRFYQQVGGLVVSLFRALLYARLRADNGDLRKSTHRSRKSGLKRGRQLYGNRIRTQLMKRHAFQLGTFHAVMEYRHGMDCAELFQIETVGHRSVEIRECFVAEDACHREP